MRWLAVMLALLLASGTLVGGIYARDRAPGTYHPATATQARADAATVLVTTEGWHCPGCAVTRLERGPGGTWLARLRIRSEIRCVLIDLARFSFTPRRGLTGVRYVACS